MASSRTVPAEMMAKACGVEMESLIKASHQYPAGDHQSATSAKPTTNARPLTAVMTAASLFLCPQTQRTILQARIRLALGRNGKNRQCRCRDTDFPSARGSPQGLAVILSGTVKQPITPKTRRGVFITRKHRCSRSPVSSS